MDYSLAKKLKDAGFTQEVDERVPAPHVFLAPTKQIVNGKPEPTLSEEVAYAPTLEELIEACGEEFRYLIRDDGENNWRCWGKNNPLVRVSETPAEAVARLWLSLQESNK